MNRLFLAASIAMLTFTTGSSYGIEPEKKLLHVYQIAINTPDATIVFGNSKLSMPGVTILFPNNNAFFFNGSKYEKDLTITVDQTSAFRYTVKIKNEACHLDETYYMDVAITPTRD